MFWRGKNYFLIVFYEYLLIINVGLLKCMHNRYSLDVEFNSTPNECLH